MYLFKIDDEVRLYNRPLGKVPVLSDAVLLAKIWKPRERAGKERSTPGSRLTGNVLALGVLLDGKKPLKQFFG